MRLATPAGVQKLQTALHAKAKGSPSFRFYALYDKVYRKDILAFAYECCRANGGAAGVDGQRFEDIEAYGVERWLDELAQELKNRTYQPLPVRRVYIPKPNGKQRPLGVPAVRDRTAEMAAVLVLEPIFEADLQPEQYAYRRDRSALDAVNRVHKLIYAGHQEIVVPLTRRFDGTDVAANYPDHEVTALINTTTSGAFMTTSLVTKHFGSIMSGRRLSGCTASGERGNPEGSSRQRESEAKRESHFLTLWSLQSSTSVIAISRQLTTRTDSGRRIRSGVTSRKATLLLASS